MDSRIDTQERIPTAEMASGNGRMVFFTRVETGLPADIELVSEEFEIGIGTWRAKIVKQLDGNAGRPRFKARFDAAPHEVWARRRLRRLADRLNARRRLSD